MIQLEHVPTPDQVMHFYWRGMAQGYGSNNPPSDHEYLTGWKKICYSEETQWGTLVLTDQWGEGHCGPGGTTQIHFSPRAHIDSQPSILLWVHRYRGSYVEDIVPALTEILQTYWRSQKEKLFYGGRAPSIKELPRFEHLQYENLSFCGEGSFLGSEGLEFIYHKGQKMGQHSHSCTWVL